MAQKRDFKSCGINLTFRASHFQTLFLARPDLGVIKRSCGWALSFKRPLFPFDDCEQQRHPGTPQTTSLRYTELFLFLSLPSSAFRIVCSALYLHLLVRLDRSALSRWQEVDIHLSTVWLREDTSEWGMEPVGHHVERRRPNHTQRLFPVSRGCPDLLNQNADTWDHPHSCQRVSKQN